MRATAGAVDNSWITAVCATLYKAADNSWMTIACSHFYKAGTTDIHSETLYQELNSVKDSRWIVSVSRNIPSCR